jgi:hypothetical protein
VAIKALPKGIAAMRFRILAVALAFSAGLPAANAFEQELLGKRDINIDGYESFAGVTLTDVQGNPTDHAMDYGEYKGQAVILLQKATAGRTKTDAPVYEIVQVIRAPKPKDFEIDVAGCYLKPNTDPQVGEHIFAYAQYSDDARSKAIRGAWMFDWKTSRIVKIDDASIACTLIGD